MRVWIDLANTPHVPLIAPIAERLEADGDEVLLTARDHAQTVELARAQWGDRVEVIGGPSPDARLQKGLGIAARARDLRRFARSRRPDVAFSHGSYAQLLAARTAGVRAVTMMDYEFQPANHLSFRLAHSIVVPQAFPERELRRSGGRARKVVRYPGFKEELYLGRRTLSAGVAAELGVDPEDVLVVMRPAPEGALYHRMENDRFDGLLDLALAQERVRAVVLPRRPEQGDRYRRDFPAAIVPERAVDAASLLAHADLTIGAGGTMTRESAVLGTPTYTVFAGRLAGVDAELIRQGRLHDLRDPSVTPVLEKKAGAGLPPADHSAPILDAVLRAVRGG
jgi:predicted glycosyltransferase